jgi:hypothetical protein
VDWRVGGRGLGREGEGQGDKEGTGWNGMLGLEGVKRGWMMNLSRSGVWSLERRRPRGPFALERNSTAGRLHVEDG